MTVYILTPNIPPRIDGTLQNYCMKLKPGVFATCANIKIVDRLTNFLIKNNTKFTVVNKSKHGILPEIVEY